MDTSLLQTPPKTGILFVLTTAQSLASAPSWRRMNLLWSKVPAQPPAADLAASLYWSRPAYCRMCLLALLKKSFCRRGLSTYLPPPAPHPHSHQIGEPSLQLSSVIPPQLRTVLRMMNQSLAHVQTGRVTTPPLCPPPPARYRARVRSPGLLTPHPPRRHWPTSSCPALHLANHPVAPLWMAGIEDFLLIILTIILTIISPHTPDVDHSNHDLYLKLVNLICFALKLKGSNSPCSSSTKLGCGVNAVTLNSFS